MRVFSQRLRRLLLFGLLLAGVTALAGVCMRILSGWVRLGAVTICNLVNGGLALLFLRLSGRWLAVSLRPAAQWLWAFLLAGGLGMTIIVLPLLFGTSLVGRHADFVPWAAAVELFDNLLVIGPVEELIFREYVQGELSALLPKKTWLAVLSASALFGAWHLINGSPMQALFTFGIGCAFGFARQYGKGCTYLSCALGHGLYDSLCSVTRWLLP